MSVDCPSQSDLLVSAPQRSPVQRRIDVCADGVDRWARRLLHWCDRWQIRHRYVSQLFSLRQYAPRPLRTPLHYAKSQAPSPAPLISMVTPSFNQADFLPRTIESILQQQYPRLEYVVQDGGSRDGSVEVLEGYASRLTHWASAPDNGQAQAINLGFAGTSGEIMGWLNSDDVLLPGALNYVASYFAAHPEIDVVYGSRVIIDAHDQEIGRWLLPNHDDELLQWVDYVPQETLFWRREIWERSGAQIDESFRFAMDWDLLLRFQSAGAKFACLPRFLGAFRVTDSTKTTQLLATIGRQEMERLRLRHLGFIPTHDDIRPRLRPYLWRHLLRRCAHAARGVDR